ncbi:hypothetical protein NPIL_90451 [Nephila pilipes]|uniref:Uncharacterized protein n=1 Tax=Nephila pilipes TaxID=299642 RepID=A0A8X6Q8M1_NEPPI|nr:hypothetical protein NPIL_90451 [Nephila pilipes]
MGSYRWDREVAGLNGVSAKVWHETFVEKCRSDTKVKFLLEDYKEVVSWLDDQTEGVDPLIFQQCTIKHRKNHAGLPDKINVDQEVPEKTKCLSWLCN